MAGGEAWEQLTDFTSQGISANSAAVHAGVYGPSRHPPVRVLGDPTESN